MKCEKCSKEATEVISGVRFHAVCDDHCARYLATNGYQNNYWRVDERTRDEYLNRTNPKLSA